MTKREMFVAIREVVIDNEEMVAFIDHEIEILNKRKSEKKPTATQLENKHLKEVILAYLTDIGTEKCIKELQAEVPELTPLSNQRVSRLLSDLIGTESGQVCRTVKKRVPYFSVIA